MDFAGSALLFDFFGTLVDYDASTTEQDYSSSHQLIKDFGSMINYEDFLVIAEKSFGELDRHCAQTLDEFSMHDAAAIILERAVGRPASPDHLDAFVATYLQDWNAGVRYLDGIDDLLDQLSRRHRLAVVSNTHHLDLVPDHLTAMGVAHYFETIVLSIEVGHRKPHPAIYQAALDRLVVPATDTLFIGDTYLADYAGPRRQGIPSLLIDPSRGQDVVDHDRLDSVFDVADRLGQLRR